MASSKLFKPVTIGKITLSHRIGLCPLTRHRASDDHVPSELAVQYYKQRSSVPGTLLITEGTFISAADGGNINIPGIYNQQQIHAWRKVTDAVHANGGYIFCQLWALGRAANPEVARREGITPVSSSPARLSLEFPIPHELTIDEIKEKVQAYATAARNAIAAGFDGVELHGANGALTSMEAISRIAPVFAIEVVTAVSEAIGPEKTGIRFSPWSRFQGMRMNDPIPQFSHILRNISKLGIAYIHLVESRIAGNADVESQDSLEFAYDIWKGPLLVAGGFKPDSARHLVDEQHPDKDIIVMFGRYFISTPDLPFRIRNELSLNDYNRDTFYTPMASGGYIDYPFSDEFLAQKATA
ncbi:hypothetical protein PFICI_07354 [Pestalotiopsis fici W106-1]|uniref:NADH:flavin oxidoreductase/NADH oxidase N-terminal domain-containing protein n=1 Tax=Pestalotiopsis fici (strain W106-1 / CGMCC3.15140) TaxID=1229662 RepID=W3X175_PESFW|nr:uncharacterized protein PFICI_07354 [Pestalotiopsis fici W106-1]ETS79825.1 hypothetical protein PFICI_07354 [Pestalotiopsis fici W106-1]